MYNLQLGNSTVSVSTMSQNVQSICNLYLGFLLFFVLAESLLHFSFRLRPKKNKFNSVGLNTNTQQQFRACTW